MISRHIEVLVEYGEGELVLNNNFRAGSKLLGGDSDETRMNNFELYSITLHLPTYLQRHDQTRYILIVSYCLQQGYQSDMHLCRKSHKSSNSLSHAM